MDNVKQHGVASGTVQSQFVLEGQRTGTLDLECGGLKGHTRLPENVVGAIHIHEGQIGDLSVGFGIDDLDVQFTGLDVLDTGGSGIREPCEGGAHKHRQAQNNGQNAQYQGALGLFALFHCCDPP